jgi:hypothetical protein
MESVFKLRSFRLQSPGCLCCHQLKPHAPKWNFPVEGKAQSSEQRQTLSMALDKSLSLGAHAHHRLGSLSAEALQRLGHALRPMFWGQTGVTDATQHYRSLMTPFYMPHTELGARENIYCPWSWSLLGF